MMDKQKKRVVQDSFKPFSIIPKGNGLSPQTNKGLKELDEQMNPRQAQPQPGYSNPPRPAQPNMIRLPDGRQITPEQYQQLQQFLNQRK